MKNYDASVPLWTVVSSRRGLKIFERRPGQKGLHLIREEAVARIGDHVCHEHLLMLLDAWEDRCLQLLLVAEPFWLRSIDECLPPPYAERVVGRIEEDLHTASTEEVDACLRAILEETPETGRQSA